MANATLDGVEGQREKLVRTLSCPVCHVRPRQRCDYGYVTSAGRNVRHVWQPTSHTGRYEAAVRAGLVPALGGRR